MVRVFQIMVLSCIVSLTGCEGHKEKPIWEDVKIGDLASPRPANQPAGQVLTTVNFAVYVFEMPAEKIDTLDSIWPVLYTEPLHFSDSEAFKANSFVVGFGQTRMWDEIGNLLREAGCRKRETVLLLLSDDQAQDISVAALSREQTVFYIPSSGPVEGVTIGPGTFAFEIKAGKIPASRGVCNVDVQPLFLATRKSIVPQLAAREKSRDFAFTSCRFNLKMGPGDFFFLGPKKYTPKQVTLDSMFFSRPKPKPVVGMFLFVCTGIID